MLHLVRTFVWPGLATVPLFAQAPNLQPARVLPGVPQLGAAAENQLGAVLARGAGSSLLVFEDKRAGDSDLFGMRLDAAGAPIEAVPFPITKDPGNQSAPKVVWNGQSWLVVYSNQVDPGSGYFAYQVAALRVSVQGSVLDAAPIVLTLDNTGGGFAVASDGSGWVVAFTGYSAGNSAISAKRVAANGTVLDPIGVEIAPATYYVYFGLGAVSAGGQYLFTWSDNGLRGRRFSTALQPLDPAALLVTANAAVLASNGTQYFAVWSFQNPQYQVEVRGSRLTTSLQMLDGSGLPLSGASATESYTNPTVVWDGTQWIASWQYFGTQSQRAARISAAGLVLDPGGVDLPDNSPSYLYSPAIGALPSGGALVTWHDYRSSSTDVFGTAFTAQGTAGVERCYSIGSETLQAPRVAAGPAQYLVTAKALSANSSRILVQRVDAFGAAIDAAPITVASASHANLFTGGVAWNGTCYLVTWSDGSVGQVYGRRMRPDATFLDANPIPVLLGHSSDVAALGADFLVTALRAPSYPQYVFSYGARVRGSDGAVLDPTPLTIGSSFATRARAVALGNRWCVVTESHVSHDSNQAGVLVNFVDAAGTVAPSITLASANIQDWGSIDVASNGTSALVVFQSGSNWTNCDVYARRILADGAIPAAAFNATQGDPLGQSRASVVWTGEEYVVSYQTYQNNVWFYDYEPDVYAVRVSAAGALIDTRGFDLWSGEDYERSVDAASLGGGRALFAVSSYVDAPFAAFQIAIRELRASGTEIYGTGTPGCDGTQRLFTNGVPRLGSSAFTLYCDHAKPNSPGVVLFASTPDLVGTFYPALGLRLHLALTGARVDLPLGADALGVGSLVLPIPANPALAGAKLHTQALWSWGAACQLPPLGLSASVGMTLRVY